MGSDVGPSGAGGSLGVASPGKMTPRRAPAPARSELQRPRAGKLTPLRRSSGESGGREKGPRRGWWAGPRALTGPWVPVA